MDGYYVILTSIPGRQVGPFCACIGQDCKKTHQSGGITFFAKISESLAKRLAADVHPEHQWSDVEAALDRSPFYYNCGNFSISRRKLDEGSNS